LIRLARTLPSTTGIDDFEMRWICREREMHTVPSELAIGRGAEMVLHVAEPSTSFGVEEAAPEFMEDGAVRLCP